METEKWHMGSLEASLSGHSAPLIVLRWQEPKGGIIGPVK